MSQFKRTADRIVVYLRERGRMSGPDICDALDLDEVDVDLAWQGDPRIKMCQPVHGGGGAWYRAEEDSR